MSAPPISSIVLYCGFSLPDATPPPPLPSPTTAPPPPNHILYIYFHHSSQIVGNSTAGKFIKKSSEIEIFLTVLDDLLPTIYCIIHTHSWAQHKNYNTKTCVLFNTHTWKYWKKFINQLLHVQYLYIIIWIFHIFVIYLNNLSYTWRHIFCFYSRNIVFKIFCRENYKILHNIQVKMVYSMYSPRRPLLAGCSLLWQGLWAYP